MTSKKRRQRGSRTHGGGSHKNRRGAGHRGGRGDAGRDKHEFHNHEPLGKEGFSRPESTQTEVGKVGIQEIDETLTELELFDEVPEQPIDPSNGGEVAVADGGVKKAGPSPKGIWKPEQDSPFYIDVREFHGDYEDIDEVKLLDGGRLNHKINVITDQCSEEAKHSIKSMGGKIYFTKKSRTAINKVEDVISKRYFNNTTSQDGNEKVDKLEEVLEKIESGQDIEFHEFETLIEHYDHSDRAEDGYEAMKSYAQSLETVESIEAINLMRARDFAQVYGFSPDVFEEKLESYFEDLDVSDEYIRMQQAGLPEDLSIDNVLSGIDYIHQLHEGESESDADQAEIDDKIYLRAVDEQKSWI